ncbi:MAG: tyrosine protein phosphatase [Pseudomonadota bacterium]
MRIHVSSLPKVPEMVAAHGPSRVVSLLGPGTEFPVITDLDGVHHHKVEINDIRKPIDGLVPPGETHVTGLVDFLRRWDPSTPLLSHCWAGISRSTATAFIAACLHNPQTDEAEIASAIAAASPTAYPNTLIVSIADSLLARGGRMDAAIAPIVEDEDRIVRVRGLEEAVPFSIPARFDGGPARLDGDNA